MSFPRNTMLRDANARFNALRDFIHRWYTIRTALPAASAPGFESYVKAIGGITSGIIKPDTTAKISFKNTEVAYCATSVSNAKEVEIAIPVSYLTTQPYDTLPDYDNERVLSYYILAAVNFLTTHESCHSLYSEFSAYKNSSLETAIEKNYFDGKKFKSEDVEYVKNLTFGIRNLYEDNVIHTMAETEQYYRHIHHGLQILCNFERFDQNLEIFEEIERNNEVDPLMLVDFMSFLRNPAFHNEPIFEDTIVVNGRQVDMNKVTDIMLRSFDVPAYNHELCDRISNDTVEILKLIFPLEQYEHEKANPNEQSQFYKQGEQVGDFLDEEGKSSDFEDRRGRKIQSGDIREFLKTLIKASERSKTQSENAAVDTEHIREITVTSPNTDKEQTNKVELFERNESPSDDVVLKNFTHSKGSTPVPKRDTKFARFAQILNEIKTWKIRPRPESYDTSGIGIAGHRLHDYRTNGEIFTNQVNLQRRENNLEVLILGDMSGSMSNLYKTMIDALYSIGKSLHNAAIPYGLYLHTTDSNDRLNTESAAAYFVGGYGADFPKQQTGVMEIGLSHVEDIDMSSNIDSDIIEFLCDYRFSKAHNQKVLLVLSDGQPINGDKGRKLGMDVDTHMRYNIKRARDKGIIVIGVALIPSVVSTNQKLYGTKFTVDCSQNIEQGLRRVIQTVQENMK